MVVFCRSIFIYKPGGPEAEIEAEVRVKVQKAVDIRVRVPLFLVRAPGAPLVSLSLPVGKELFQRLYQVYSLAICLVELVSKIYVTFVFCQ